VTSEKRKTQNTSGRQSYGAAEASERPGAAGDISSLIEPYRRELHLHCYRFLGSLHDAEDLVQETMLRAWQRFDTFKGASSLRTWLYAIATNACLDALKKRLPRTLPTSAYPALDPLSPIAPAITEPVWLEPFPNAWLNETTGNPEAQYTRRESISLAFLTVLQQLPPRQRAILLLSDVLDWRASEVADLLEISVSAVNSALHRARVTLAQNYTPDERARAQIHPADGELNTLLTRYTQAWETDDVAGLVALLKEDAKFSMPPFAAWYHGQEAIRAIFAIKLFGSGQPEQWRLYPTAANAQPAFAVYRAGEAHGPCQAFGIQVITLDWSTPTSPIADITIFNTPELVTTFGLPLQLPE
jgi:RNA polymerase sigma-70 factor (ECF subfamily)